MLPQSPRPGPHITRTPTPPWAVGMEEVGLENAAERSAPSGGAPLAPRKPKRIRVQLDRRIELTDDELKVLLPCPLNFCDSLWMKDSAGAIC